jgi:uncharacterized protein
MLLFKLSATWLLALCILVLTFPFFDALFMALFDLVSFRPGEYIADYSVADIKGILVSGDLVQMFLLRWNFYFSDLPMLLIHLFPKALAMFLLGLYMGKMGYISRISEVVEATTKAVLWVAVLANLYRVFFLFGLWDLHIWQEPVWRTFFIHLMGVCESITGLFYLWLIAWLLNRGRLNSGKISRLFRPFRYVGRTALSNYLLQSLIALILFSGLGFGLYETLSPIQLFALVWLVFLFQIFISKFWLSRFQYGPMEWLWRCLSYNKRFPIVAPYK